MNSGRVCRTGEAHTVAMLLILIALAMLGLMYGYMFSSSNGTSSTITVTTTVTTTCIQPITVTVTRILGGERLPGSTNTTTSSLTPYPDAIFWQLNTSAKSFSTKVIYEYGDIVILPNGSQTFTPKTRLTVTVTSPSIEFRGPVASGEAPGLRVVVYLSNDSVRVNGTLWIKVVFEGEKAFFSDCIMLDVLNSRGEKVYGLAMRHPHPTLPLRFEPPKNISYILSWKAVKDHYLKVDVTPGNYTLAIEAGGIKMSIPITVTP
uniref:Uncharacterized protein n=1 Tax=Ignisphaera aggregans TaxID=334771 RepID=A0A7J2U107_9CREN